MDQLELDRPKADHRERVAVVEGDEPATAAQDTPAPPLSLKARMAAIRDECSGFLKEDIQMGTFKIKGHTFEAILSEIRPLLLRHGVDVTPNLAERTYTGNRCDVLVDFEFERTDDSDERRVIRWGGAGTDNGDKAFAKAGTNAVKEMLKKRFLVTDRDDAKEETESVEHQSDEKIGRGDLEKAQEGRRDAIAKWATVFKAALSTAATVKDIQRLERENTTQLSSEDLPDVTRTFFIELIVARKKDLAQQGTGAGDDPGRLAE